MHSAAHILAASKVRWWRHYLPIILLGTIVLVFPGIPQSFAHSSTVNSSPKPFESMAAAPKEVKVFFSEPIELSYSKITVIGSDGSRVDMNDQHFVDGDAQSIAVTLRPNLPDGVYTVTTRVLSAVDGHVVDGAYTFGVGAGTAVSTDVSTVKPAKVLLLLPEALSKFPGMVGQVMVVGAAFATLWLWKPVGRVPWLFNALAAHRVAIDRNMIKIVVIGATLVLASGAAMIIVQATSIGAGIIEAIATKFGNVWLARMLLSSILMAIALAVYRKAAKSNTSPSRVEVLVMLVIGFAVLATSSLIVHAAATSQIGPIALDFFHDAAASIWIGGIILLGFVAAPKLFGIREEKVKLAAISILIPRFSTIVVTLLGVSLLTGPLLLSVIESNLSLTLASFYGKVLIVKLALVGVMLTLGAYSQLVTQKKAITVMSRTITAPPAGGHITQTQTPLPSFKNSDRILKAEAIVGIALLLTVSLMTNSSIPSAEFPLYKDQLADGQTAAYAQQQPQTASVKTDFKQTVYVKDGKVELFISPFVVGQNSFKISFLKPDGKSAIAGIDSVNLKITQVDKGIGPINVDTSRQSEGVFTANAAFSLHGTWTVFIEGVSSQSNNIIASLDVDVKPPMSSLEFALKEYKIPDKSLPLYPLFDAKRHSVWVGDTLPQSGRIWQLDVVSGNYTMHKIENANLITQMVLDSGSGGLWYIDPTKGILGIYNLENKSTKQFAIPEKGVVSGLAIDNNGNLWMPVVQPNKVVKFDPAGEKFSTVDIPTPEAQPAGIKSDSSGNVWLAESIGKIAMIDPATGNITEFEPKGQNKLEVPTAVFPDPRTGSIFIAEHEGHTVTVLHPLFETFGEYPVLNQDGLPFGMAMDSYDNLWYAEHVIDRLAVIDPRTGQGTEVQIPTSGSTVQWLTSDDQGRIWFAEQRGGALGTITITTKNPSLPASSHEKDASPQSINTGQSQQVVKDVGFSFSQVAGPSIAAGIPISAIFYAKSVIDLKRSMKVAIKAGR
jgi:copper transport protein